MIIDHWAREDIRSSKRKPANWNMTRLRGEDIRWMNITLTRSARGSIESKIVSTARFGFASLSPRGTRKKPIAHVDILLLNARDSCVGRSSRTKASRRVFFSIEPIGAHLDRLHQRPRLLISIGTDYSDSVDRKSLYSYFNSKSIYTPAPDSIHCASYPLGIIINESW